MKSKSAKVKQTKENTHTKQSTTGLWDKCRTEMKSPRTRTCNLHSSQPAELQYATGRTWGPWKKGKSWLLSQVLSSPIISVASFLPFILKCRAILWQALMPCIFSSTVVVSFILPFFTLKIFQNQNQLDNLLVCCATQCRVAYYQCYNRGSNFFWSRNATEHVKILTPNTCSIWRDQRVFVDWTMKSLR